KALARTGFVAPAGTWTRDDVLAVLAGVGGPEQAFLTGVCVGVAERGGLLVLDGMLTGTAALLAARLRPGLENHLVAGHCSAEPGHPAVLHALGLEPILDVRLRAGEGVGAVLALSLLRHAVRMRAATVRTR
ncbi:MAG TPA: nicotinate-nucleotide--dimethylbenzimidazole phosphoribosyltransferase, partial [Mycobacteriales bacterium]|nr:nicotinate-nucleotide--dimethylbenzimidazole phosphoribosyltransferase [Mycobacteriales bacterium]